MQMPSNMNRTEVRTHSIGKPRGDGALPIVVKVDLSRERRRLPGGRDVHYDGKEAQVDYPDYAFFKDIYTVEGHYEYTVLLEKRMKDADPIKIKAIEGADAIRKRVDQLDPRAADLLRSRLSAASLEREFRQVHALDALPDGPVKKGASWERTVSMDRGAGLKLVVRRKYEYAGTEKKGGKDLDKLNAKILDIHFRQDKDSASPLKLTKEEIKVSSSEGTVYFDRQAGWLVEARERVEMSGDLTLSAQEQDQRTSFDLTIRTELQFQP
jgi:hypothetical protein